MRRSFALLCGLLLLSSVALADTFTISDIRLQGLQRVSAGTVFNLLPVNVGDSVDEVTIRNLIRILFHSGYFNDVRMARDDDVLVITLDERPAIESIEIKGNKAIKTDALKDGLAQQGLKEGEIFKQATLERVGIELQRQYVAQGRYGASINTDVENLPRNRVDIKINIEEGKNSSIQHINVVGASVFTEKTLLDQLELKHPSLFSFYRNDDRYSREKLSADLESLESYYKDRGYVQFNIESTQVSISPDRRQVYITMDVNEGDKYTVNTVDLVGELHDIRPEVLRRLFVVAPGQVFSQARVTATEDRITQALGNSGYTFATASGVPKVNDDGTVDVEFFVDAGKRAYVRRVTFAGNTITKDEVLRREMRQMEGGWASTAQIDLSKVRLERLGYFKTVNVETPEVPGTDDQVDVDFTVEEQPSSSISATLGYSQSYGLILGANYQASNVLGSGNTLGIGLSWSEFQRSASFNFFDPYYTLDGISRGFNLYFRESDYNQANITPYSTDSYGGGVNFGFPIGETRRIDFGANIDYTRIQEGTFPVQEIAEFIDKNGDSYLDYKLNLSWSSSTLNRGLFPTRGQSQQLGMEVAVPGSELQYYKLTYKGQIYFPIASGWSLRLRTDLGFGDGYDGTEGLPFYENYFSGGFGSVRGFQNNTLGPRSTDPLVDINGDGIPDQIYTRKPPPFGGNLLTEASAEIVFPLPLIKDNGQFRPVFFFDAGNVFNTNCPDVSTICEDFSLDEIRYSVGLSVTWLTGLGPMTFALAKPFNAGQFDSTETFQFELGRTF